MRPCLLRIRIEGRIDQRHVQSGLLLNCKISPPSVFSVQLLVTAQKRKNESQHEKLIIDTGSEHCGSDGEGLRIQPPKQRDQMPEHGFRTWETRNIEKIRQQSRSVHDKEPDLFRYVSPAAGHQRDDHQELEHFRRRPERLEFVSEFGNAHDKNQPRFSQHHHQGVQGLLPQADHAEGSRQQLSLFRQRRVPGPAQAGVSLDRKAILGAAGTELLQGPEELEKTAAAVLPDQAGRPERLRRFGKFGQARAAHQPVRTHPAGDVQELEKAGRAPAVGERDKKLHGRRVRRADEPEAVGAGRQQDQLAERGENSGKHAEAGADRHQVDADRVQPCQVVCRKDPGEQHRN